jgi:hypothetical protein
VFWQPATPDHVDFFLLTKRFLRILLTHLLLGLMSLLMGCAALSGTEWCSMLMVAAGWRGAAHLSCGRSQKLMASPILPCSATQWQSFPHCAAISTCEA